MMRKLLYSFLFLFITYSSFAQIVSTYTTTGSWTVPDGATQVTVEIWGAGGAGGGSNFSGYGGGGGGGGGYSIKTFSVTAGQTINYTIGTGGTASSGNNGNAGGGSSLIHTPSSTSLTANGGGGGSRNGTLTGGTGGTGGTASGGDTNATGSNGTVGSATGGNGGNSGNTPGSGGAGVTNGNGSSGVLSGGGGGGGERNGTTNRSGGAGANGQVRITYVPSYQWQFVSANLGSTNWCPGETRNVSITIKNTGSKAWITSGSDEFRIGVKWSGWGDYNVRVPAQNLAPGATATYTFTVSAVNEDLTALSNGANSLSFDVVYEHVAWFGNNNGGTGPGNTVYTAAQTILAAPINRTVGAASSSVCAGNGTNITVTSPVSGVSYQLRDGTTPIGSPATGSSGTLNLPTGNLTTTTTFNVLATNTTTSCSTQMTNTPTVNITPLPTTSNAGPTQNGSGPFTLAANTPSVGTGVWAIVSGPNTSTSQLSSTTNPTATFNPIGTGTYVLSWTITNGCGTSTSQVTIVANCVSNLLKNGNFNNGTADWSAATGRGSYSEVLTESVYFSNGSPNNTAELDSQASLRQQVTVIPNTPYALSFIYARRPGSEATVGVTARILESTTTISSVNYTTSNTTSTPFIGTLTFTPTTSTIFVELYNTLSTTTLGSIIDNIVLTPSPQVAPMATTVPKGSFATLSPICAGTSVQLDVDNVPTSGVTYSWSSTSPGAVFSSTTIKNPTITFASTLTGIQEVTVVVTPSTGCAGAPSSTYVNLIAAPAVYNVTGGTVCSGTGIVIGLSGSSTNVSYQLQLNGANNGTAVAGTGSAINFGSKTAAGTYTVIATNTASNSCSLAMSGSAVIKQIQGTPTIASYTDLDCVSAGTITLGNLPSGAWQINQTGQATATITGSGTSYQITGLAAGNYTFTVETTTTCASNSASRLIADSSTSTWNGSTWVGGTPTSAKKIIIASNTGTPFPAGTPVVNGCSLTINTGITVTVPSGVTLVITNAVTTNGQLTFKTNSSLVQTTNATNTGSITYERETNVRRYDLTYWSTPVTDPGFKLSDLSPATLGDKYFIFAPNSGWIINYNGTQVMEAGKGYSVRAPQPYDINIPSLFTGKFTGIPNNGDINPTVVSGTYNLVGNPYPSAISAIALINGNSNLGTIYLWTHNTLPQGVAGDNKYYYTSDDYAAYNLTGAAQGALLNGQPFQEYIAAGQGFLAQPKTATMNFNNNMRRNSNNQQFYKTTESVGYERNRVWLNLTNEQGAFKQALIGYIEGATNGLDINYDAGSLEANPYIDFYSVNEANKLTIQGRSLPFDDKDIVPLGYNTTIAGEFTIAIDRADGLFDTQEVYLEDLLTNKIVSLRDSNYKFTTAIGNFENRFNLRYTSKTLGTGEFEDLDSSILVSIKNKVIKISSSKEILKEVNIYNAGAQLLYNKNKVNSTELQISNLNSSDQVLLVKVTLENGHTVTKKIVFSNL